MPRRYVTCRSCGDVLVRDDLHGWMGFCAKCWPTEEQRMMEYAAAHPELQELMIQDLADGLLQNVQAATSLTVREATFIMMTAKQLTERGYMTPEALAEITGYLGEHVRAEPLE